MCVSARRGATRSQLWWSPHEPCTMTTGEPDFPRVSDHRLMPFTGVLDIPTPFRDPASTRSQAPPTTPQSPACLIQLQAGCPELVADYFRLHAVRERPDVRSDRS